jgi:DNA-binding transcriptional ArsR family regulator
MKDLLRQSARVTGQIADHGGPVGRGRVESLLVDVDGNYVSARLVQVTSDREPDPVGRSGDDGGAAGEISHARYANGPPSGRSLVVKPQPSKLAMRVRFPPPALSDRSGILLSILKTAERIEARRLRREETLPISEIASRLGVSKSSVSVWVRDVELSPEQRAELRLRNPAMSPDFVGTRIWAERCRSERRGFQARGRRLARRGEPLHAAGCMLYWAEGEKHRNRVALANADPDVLRLFLAFLRTYFGVQNERVAIYCNLFAESRTRQDEIEAFWLRTLGLPSSCLRKSTVNVYSKYSAKKRRNRLPYGTCKLVVCETAIVQSVYGAIQEYGGFDRPEWLDLRSGAEPPH